MQIKLSAVAGNPLSGDVQVTISPNPENTLDIIIESTVMAPFGDSINTTAQDVLADFSITNACVQIVDKGALDWVIRARLQAAICRATDQHFDWKGEDA